MIREVITSLPTSSSSGACVPDCRDASIGWLNVHSLAARDQATAVQTTITDESLDIMVLTETWHRSSDDVCLRLAILAGFTVADAVRETDPRYGGVAVIYRSSYDCRASSPTMPSLHIDALYSIAVCHVHHSSPLLTSCLTTMTQLYVR